jgi:hypothetical protein
MKTQKKLFANETEFGINNSTQLLTTVPIVIFWIAFSLLAIMSLTTILQIVTGIYFEKNTVMDLIGLFFGVLIVLTLPFQIVNQFNSIKVSKEGLYVKVFIFYYQWKLVPWNEIYEVKISPLLDRWKKPIWCIKVKNLTYIHSLLSQQYQTGVGYSIIITSETQNRDELLDIVNAYLEKNILEL